MATAGIGTLSGIEDSISCSVCLEIFDDPQIFSCLHSLCRKCVGLLLKDGRIICPQCRVQVLEQDVKANFTLKAVAEWFLGQSQRKTLQLPPSVKAGGEGSQAFAPKEVVCDLCELAAIENYFCSNCERILCERCKRSHLKTTDCEEKSAEKFQIVSTKYEKSLDEKSDVLASEIATVKMILETVLSTYDQEEGKALNANHEAKKEIYQAVDNYFNVQQDLVKRVVTECKQKAELICNTTVMNLSQCREDIQQVKSSGPVQVVRKFKDLSSEFFLKQEITDQLETPALEIKSLNTTTDSLQRCNFLQLIPSFRMKGNHVADLQNR